MRVESDISTHDTIRQLVQALNHRLTIVDNLQAKLIEVPDTGSANADIVITHNLGKVPVAYFWNISIEGVVYDEDRLNWTTTSMKLRCSAANAAIVVVVF